MKRFVKISAAILLLIAVIYAGGIFYFQTHFLPNTIVNQIDLSCVSKTEIKSRLTGREFKIFGPNQQAQSFVLDQLGLHEDFVSEDFEINQNVLMWPLSFFKQDTHSIEVKRDVDDKTLKQAVDKMSFFSHMIAPEDARIVRKGDQFEIVPEVKGNFLEKEIVEKDIRSNFKEGKNELQLENLYQKPKITQEQLEPKKDQLNQLVSHQVTLKLPDGEQKIKMINFMDEAFNFSRQKVQGFVQELKQKYDNIGKTRVFKTSAGNEIEVKGGNFGVKINEDKTVAAIIDAFNAHDNQTFEPVYTSTAMNQGLIGNTYIEISIAKQRMWFYKAGQLVVETPIVTGNVNMGYYTPKGVWKVWVKERNRRLKGKNHDGSDYDVPVKYWMQIDYSGIGIHDTYYRGAYGGSIYRYNGSHGCINTPLKAVQAIYNGCEYGTPVVIY